ncbi:MAG: AAA family ATPase [Calditrichaeota bacterium]|nr:AAA family ATPase [Calditrichota bacterium]
MSSRSKEVPPNKLRYFYDPKQFKFKTTDELEPLSEIIGQDRAVTAVDFGVQIKNLGYNIFAVGPTGAGRTSTIRDAVQKRAKKLAVPPDWCYVYNFQNGDRPVALKLAPGDGRKLAKAMNGLIVKLARDVPAALNSEEFQRQKKSIMEQLQIQQQNLLNGLTEKAHKKGFSLRKIASGLVLLPVLDGKPLTVEQIDALPEEQREKLQEVGARLQEELNDGLKSIRNLEQEMQEKLEKHLKEILRLAIDNPIAKISEQFEKYPKVVEYLEEAEEDLLNTAAGMFSEAPEEEEAEESIDHSWIKGLQLHRYRVNVFVDNSETKGAPVIVETNPTYNNLIGRIDRVPRKGLLLTDFTKVKSGSLQRANGGFLIIDAEQLFRSALAWQALKRSLKNQCAEITDLSEESSHLSVRTLEPEPIPLDIKIILIGSSGIYYTLLSYDSDFSKLFKVKADFSVTMPLNKRNILNYARYCAGQCQKENLLPLSPDAMSRVVEYGVEIAEDQKKLTTRFNYVRDVLVEANYFAQKNQHRTITGEDVREALAASRFRHNKYEELIQEMFREKTLYLNVSGYRVGEVNGLTVLDLGDYTMGKPTRITARVSLGQDGVLAIDREVKMSGPLHNKGVLILSGFLQGMFGADKKISISASITFEQVYSTVDGDSASSAELYALLSSLSEIPINQSFAVTGSVNQMGEIQPIGGAKYKIEGFFDVCAAHGLTGEQGVLIPKSNLANLVLHDRVIDAVKEGKFHIYAVATVQEGIEILTGKKAGRRGKNGKFPAGTVFRAVDERLEEMAEKLNSGRSKQGKKNS